MVGAGVVVVVAGLADDFIEDKLLLVKVVFAGVCISGVVSSSHVGKEDVGVEDSKVGNIVVEGDDVEVCTSFDVDSAVLVTSGLKNNVVYDVSVGVEVASSVVWKTDISAAVEVTTSEDGGTDGTVEKSKVESAVAEDANVSVVVGTTLPEMFELRVLKLTVDVV